MCIKDKYNKIIESNNWQEISDFTDNCEGCPKLSGGCDYLGWIDDRLKELDGELEYCSQCNSRIALNEGEQAFYDDNNNVYCEDCWIQYEAAIRGLS